MPEATPHAREKQRLEALYALQILDTPAEERFDRFVRLGCAISGCPVSLVSLVDEKRQWFKARLGIDACETGRDQSFCAYVVRDEAPLIIEDATDDHRVADMDIVTKPPKIRAYAGIPIRDSNGWPLGSFCVIDFEPRRFPPQTIELLKDLACAVENEISNYELNALARELAAEKQKAEDASRAKSEFLAFMSHEIRTPLNGVLSIADLLSKSNLTHKQQRLARIIRSSGDLMLVLINDILDFSKLEADALELDDLVFSLTDWARDIADLFKFTAAEKGIAFILDIDPRLPDLIRGDALRLKQIAMNLLSNAFKFTHTGSITFRLLATDRETLSLEVEDTGIGISAEAVQRLFQPYQQGDSGVYRRFGGTGLGLHICKRLAELMGGKIGVRSDVDSGSRFSVEVPLLTASADESVPPFDLANHVLDRDIDLLVIEDNAINRQVLHYLLQGMPVKLHEASSAMEGLNFIRSKQAVDAILLDLRLEDLSGYDVAREIRAWEARTGRKPVKIIAHSADYDAETRRRCIESGMNGFVAKPVNPDELRSALSSIAE